MNRSERPAAGRLPSSLRSIAPSRAQEPTPSPSVLSPESGVLRVVGVSGQRGECFTASQQRWVVREVSQLLRRLRDEHGSRVLISGMTEGVELWAAQEAMSLGYSLWAYMPFPQQAQRWSGSLRDEWELARGLSACEVYASTSFHRDAYRQRDELIARDCHALIGVHARGVGRGSVFDVMRSACRAGANVFDVDSERRTVRCVDEALLPAPSARVSGRAVRKVPA